MQWNCWRRTYKLTSEGEELGEVRGHRRERVIKLERKVGVEREKEGGREWNDWEEKGCV